MILSFWKNLKFKFAVTTWPFGGIGKKIARIPGIGMLVGPILWNEKNLDASYVPVGEAVETGQGSVLPLDLLRELVSSASSRFIMERCICRMANCCTAHPMSVGCLFLGRAADQIDPSLGKTVGVEEAMLHVMQARRVGLLPCIIHSSFDASILSIDYRTMLTVCFCCNCCCVFRTDMKKGPEAYLERIAPLPGVSLEDRGGCVGCGECAKACFAAAITLQPGGPVFADYCKACGRCADACPRGNIRIVIDPSVDTRRILLERINARTDISG